MNKLKVVSILGGIAMLLPMAASAATTQTFLVLDGNTTATIQAGDSVDGALTFNNTGNSTVQSIKVESPGSHFPGACIDVSDVNATGTHTATFPIDTTGATEGTWDVKITTYGKPSNQVGANNNCDSTIGSSSNHTFQDVLTLTASLNSGSNANNTGSASTGGSTGNSVSSAFQTAIDALKAQIAALTAQLTGLTGVVAGVVPDAICAQMPTDTRSLQTFLMTNGQAGPFNSIGVYAATGFYGSATSQAVSNFKTAHKCK